ncbi:uncharacterized protein LOC142324436 [Lycorma delicatula]|uniref:uncharacterized protein LOC142324436 n=1 Tax=Lycorma delicatula TaxID=130591 RepID=UPI003F512D35
MDFTTTTTVSTATLLAAIVLLFSSVIPATQGEPDREQRVGRSDVRAVLGDKLDPSFWPTRGRRSSDSSEENQPPFWANRGRSLSERRLDDLQNLLDERTIDLNSAEDAPPFWANRGRNVHKICNNEKRISEGNLYAEEPRWVLLDRRDLDNVRPDPFWVARGRRALLDTLGTAPTEFWAARGKKAPIKKSVEAIRALGLTNDQFWPARGKRDVHEYNLTH